VNGLDGWAMEWAGQREVVLQACWARQVWTNTLKTDCGKTIAVEFAGWPNRGPGPDFSQARLRLDGREYQGPVEIHLSEGDWFHHGHDRDSAYGGVILHVVLQRTPGKPALNAQGAEIPVLCAGEFMDPFYRPWMAEAEELLRRREALPGRCGVEALKGDTEGLVRVWRRAAEARAQNKAQRLAMGTPKEDGQKLFEEIFRSLGYREYAQPFVELAKQFPLESLWGPLKLPYMKAREEILARWFGWMGFLAVEPEGGDPALLEEFRLLRSRWQGLNMPLRTGDPVPGGGRPWNAPERRLVAMFHHVYQLGQENYLKGWLKRLRDIDPLRNKENLKNNALEALEEVFSTPRWEGWRRRVSFRLPPLGREADLVGVERLATVAANGVIPVFLAMARRDGDRELESLLYRLFHVLPPEGANRKTKFMAERLMIKPTTYRSLSGHQGLIQLHDDFCGAFLQGCAGCALPAMISQAGTVSSSSHE